MILVLLGTQKNEFNRLLEAIEKNIVEGNIKEKVIVQAGCTKYSTDLMEIFDLIPKEDIEELKQRRKELETGIDDIEIKLSNRTIAFKERLINHSVDTFVASKISMQETEWNNKKYVSQITKNLDIINNSDNYKLLKTDELIDYIEKSVKYDRG